MRTIAVISQKGGVGKTCTTLNLAAAMAGEGYTVLAIDGDTQGNLSHALLGGSTPTPPTLSEVLAGDVAIDDAVVPTSTEGVYLLPAVPGLADVTVNLATEIGRERLLLAAMEQMTRRFDFCLIDTGPNRTLLTTNVLGCAREVLVPLAPSLYGYMGLQQLQIDMAKARRNLGNKQLALLGLLVTMTEKTKISRDFESQLREVYGGQVFTSTIPRSVKFEEAAAKAATIFEHARFSPGALAYQAVTREVLDRGRSKEEHDHVAETGAHGGHDLGAA